VTISPRPLELTCFFNSFSKHEPRSRRLDATLARLRPIVSALCRIHKLQPYPEQSQPDIAAQLALWVHYDFYATLPFVASAHTLFTTYVAQYCLPSSYYSQISNHSEALITDDHHPTTTAASPTVAHHSGSPTPLPDRHVDATRPRRLRSRSPLRVTETNRTIPSREPEDAPRRETQQQPHAGNMSPSASRKPIVAQLATPRPGHSRHVSIDRPVTPPQFSNDKTSATLPKPLLEDDVIYQLPSDA
jgi:hypothetical protein